MEGTENRTPEDNHGTNVQSTSAESSSLPYSQDDNGTKKTPVRSVSGSEVNLGSNVPPKCQSRQESSIGEQHSNMQEARVNETEALKADGEEEQTLSLSRQDTTDKEGEAKVQTGHVLDTVDPLKNTTHSEQKTPGHNMDILDASQPLNGQAKNDNGKQTQGPSHLNANSDASTTHNRETSDEAFQQSEQASTECNIPELKEELHSLTVKKGGVDEGAEHTCRTFKDQGIQCCEDQVNISRHIPKAQYKLGSGHSSKSCYNALPHTFAGIALAVALYTQLFSIPSLKQCTPLETDPEHFQQTQEFLKVISKRLTSVESRMEESTANIKSVENMLKHKAFVYKDDISNFVQKAEFEDHVRESEQNLKDRISEEVEKSNSLKDQFLKLRAEVSNKFEGISNIKNEQNELKTNFRTLEEKLEKQSQDIEDIEKNEAEVVKEISQHKEAVRDLNLSLENLGSNVKYLAENVTGISIETLVLNKRTEDIKENLFDKGSLILVIMIITVLVVVIIIYLFARKDSKRHLYWNVDNIEQEVNDGGNNNPAPYSTAGRILSQVQANPRLQRKLCVVSFYEETHPLHMRMTQSVTEQLNIQVVEFVIRRHEDILNIPPVSLLFLFVDFNERNVILEDPTLGLGDLRLTTVQAVQKMGGKIVIFYVQDQNSRTVAGTKLFNEDLVTVTRQRELSNLNRHSRFVSAYDQLTDFQKTHLQRIVRDDVN